MSVPSPDNFNLTSLSSPVNYFASHSVQGRHHQRSYMHSVTSRGVKLAFVAVDATLLPGPKRPFNFVGELLLISRCELSIETRALFLCVLVVYCEPQCFTHKRSYCENNSKSIGLCLCAMSNCLSPVCNANAMAIFSIFENMRAYDIETDR